VYLFMRWLYVRLGITSSPAERLEAAAAGGKTLLGHHSSVHHHDSGSAALDFDKSDLDLDLVLEGQLELTDMYGNRGSANGGLDAAAGRLRDGGPRSKQHTHAV
jgi:hypothetical protein